MPPTKWWKQVLEIACGEAGANKWDKQISYVLPKALVKGQSYVMTVKVKASDGGTFAAWPIWEASDNKTNGVVVMMFSIWLIMTSLTIILL